MKTNTQSNDVITLENKVKEEAKNLVTIDMAEELRAKQAEIDAKFKEYITQVMGEAPLGEKQILNLIRSAKKTGESYKGLLVKASVHGLVFAYGNGANTMNNFSMLTELYAILDTNERDSLALWAKACAPIRLAKLENGEFSFRLDKKQDAKPYDFALAISKPFYQYNTAKAAVDKIIEYLNASSIKQKLEKIIEQIDKVENNKSKTLQLLPEDKEQVDMLKAGLRSLINGTQNFGKEDVTVEKEIIAA